MSPTPTAPFATQAFAHRNVAITGARRGIGAAVARAFLALGARVAAHVGVAPAAPDDPLLNGLKADERERLDLFEGDLGEESGCAQVGAALAAAMPAIDVFIHNAGTMFGRVATRDMTAAHMGKVTRLNAESAVLLMPPLHPALVRAAKERGEASVIFTSSISARTGGGPGSSVYSASKAYVSGYARSLARELAGDAIRVNVVSPGTIETDFHQRYSTAEKLAETARAIPMQRLGSAEDCVGAYLFLAAPELSGYITGQTIEVNGGQLIC